MKQSTGSVFKTAQPSDETRGDMREMQENGSFEFDLQRRGLYGVSGTVGQTLNLTFPLPRASLQPSPLLNVEVQVSCL